MGWVRACAWGGCCRRRPRLGAPLVVGVCSRAAAQWKPRLLARMTSLHSTNVYRRARAAGLLPYKADATLCLFANNHPFFMNAALHGYSTVPIRVDASIYIISSFYRSFTPAERLGRSRCRSGRHPQPGRDAQYHKARPRRTLSHAHRTLQFNLN